VFYLWFVFAVVAAAIYNRHWIAPLMDAADSKG
jgi:hypothetical protein